PGGAVRQVRRQQPVGRAHEGGQHVLLAGTAPAGDVGQPRVDPEVVLDAHRGHVGGDVVVVQQGAVEVFRVDRGCQPEFRAGRVGRRITGQADGRHATVGDVLVLHVQQVDDHPGCAVEPEAERWSDAPALVLGDVAAGDFTVLRHQVESQ